MTKIQTYGLIGKKLDHSFSPDYFKKKFQRENLSDCSYELFPLVEIQDFLSLIKSRELAGLNVTIPYKQAIIPFLDDLSEEAQAIQAVNCIAFEGAKLKGYNTDVIGFEQSLKPLLNEQVRQGALVLGTGGASKAVAYVLQKLNIAYSFVSRNPSSGELSYEQAEARLLDFPLIINTTPLGTYPNIDGCPLKTMQGIGQGHLIYDLVYNPTATALLRNASALGARTKNGMEMLEIQAEESWKIWHTSG